MKVGVLAYQGAVEEHLVALREAGAEPVEVRAPEQLEQVERLILPGGESTTIGKLLDRLGLLEPIRRRAQAGMPVWGTCAGMILLARELEDGLPDQPVLGLMDVRVRRNAYGRQVDSFETRLYLPAVSSEPVPAVFIRAPQVRSAGPGVQVLGCYQGQIVAVRQGALLATAFHPELTSDRSLHRYFLELARCPAAPCAVG